MMQVLRRLSIRGKLIAMLMMTSATVLVVSATSFVIWDYFRFRSDIVRELSIQAQMVLENTTAAISFEDPQTARETLETLRLNRHIRGACLYDPAGALFAQVQQSRDAAPCPRTAPPVGHTFGVNRLELTEATRVAGQPAGSVWLESDLGEVAARVRALVVTVGVVLTMTLCLAYLLSIVLQRLVSDPLSALAATARAISERADYSLRARKSTDDELGVLVDAFNGMLQEIQLQITRERDANRLKDEFLAAVSHELRTPLNAILGWLQILRTTTPSELTARRALASLERNAHSQSKLLEDLIDVSRIVTGKLQIHMEVVDLGDVIQRALEVVGPAALEKSLQLKTSVPSSPCLVNGDSARLEQVVVNLLSNAVKFTGRGGTVGIELASHTGDYAITVADTGVGISAAFLPHVFERFRQADGSMTREFGGLGLGLAIVQELVLLHGGAVTAESAGGGAGATFTVRLPRLAATERRQRQPAPSLLDGGSIEGIRVFVVDDDADALEITARFAGEGGAIVGTARSGSEALAQWSNERWQVLVCDLAMPRVDGFEVLREVRRLDAASGTITAAVALTAHASEDFRLRSLAAGFQEHVAKPYDKAALVTAIVRAVRAVRQPPPPAAATERRGQNNALADGSTGGAA